MFNWFANLSRQKKILTIALILAGVVIISLVIVVFPNFTKTMKDKLANLGSRLAGTSSTQESSPIFTPTPADNAYTTTNSSPSSSPSNQPSPIDSPTTSPTNPPTATPTDSPSNTPTDTPSSAPTNDDSDPGLASCGSDNNFFTVSPLNLSDFISMVPLGNLNPTGHVFPTDHIYMYLRRSGDGTANVPLYAPGNATVTQINGSEHVDEGFTDYSITLQPCDELKLVFGHVTSLSSGLSEALTAPFQWDSTYSTGGKTYRNFGKNVSIAIIAGEEIGTTGGNPGQNALDIGAYDSRVTLNFANSSRFAGRDTIHTACPINYYFGDLKTTLMNLFGDYDGDPKRTVEPICGTIEQDIAETAQGIWFVKGTTTLEGEDPHLALVHDNMDPTKAVFSVGNSMSPSGLSGGTYSFIPQNSGLINRDFDDIRADGNIYCFEPNYLTGAILLQLQSPTTLRIEKQTSTSCAGGSYSFGTTYTDFER